MAVQLWTKDSGWLVYSHCHRSNITIAWNQPGCLPKTIGWQTPIPDHPMRNPRKGLQTSFGVSESTQYSGILNLKCLIFSILFLVFLDGLAKKMKFVQQHAWAPNTLRSISSEWKAFVEFCMLANILFLPIEPWVLCFFAMWLVSTGRVKTRDSLAQYVSAVRTVHRRLEFPDIPTPSQYGPLDLILKGVRRLAMHKTRKIPPCNPPYP